MDKESIEKIESLVMKGLVLNVGDKEYSFNKLNPIFDNPQPEPISIHTLSGMIDYIIANKDNLNIAELMLHVKSHNRVELRDTLSERKTRNCYAVSYIDGVEFEFNEYIEHDEFVVNLQSMFIPTKDLEKLLYYCGRINVENNSEITDNGITQTATVKKGISGAIKEKEIVPSPVILAPYRTFREIEQPESKFIFRIKQSGASIKCGLFEADGGSWKLMAIQRIAAWLHEKKTGIAILA